MKLVKSDVKLLWLAGCVHKMPTLVAAPPWSVILRRSLSQRNLSRQLLCTILIVRKSSSDILVPIEF
jgi:hypothetical protein